MTGPNGRNPLRHDCNGDGCWRNLHCPAIEDFAAALPGNIAFTDVDDFYVTLTEVGYQYLLIDHKAFSPGPGAQFVIPTGQKICWERLSAEMPWRFSVVVLTHAFGQPKATTGSAWIVNGKTYPWHPGSRGDFINELARWSAKAVAEGGHGRDAHRPETVAPFTVAGFAPGLSLAAQRAIMEALP